jgi:hypothetical protein
VKVADFYLVIPGLRLKSAAPTVDASRNDERKMSANGRHGKQSLKKTVHLRKIKLSQL